MKLHPILQLVKKQRIPCSLQGPLQQPLQSRSWMKGGTHQLTR